MLLLLIVALMVGTKAATAKRAPAPAAAPPTAAPLAPGDLLVPGASYRAEIKLTGIEAAFGTAPMVQAKLEEAGFQGVTVDAKGDGAFEATGKWGGGAVAAKLPPQVTSVWKL